MASDATAVAETSKEVMLQKLLPMIPTITDEWVRSWIELDRLARSRTATKER